MSVAVVDYGSGNLRSAAKALAFAAKSAARSPEVFVSEDPEKVAVADRVVLPGVGAFADCMAGLSAIDGMREALEDVVNKRGQPFLGICVGMQLMAERGLEYGTHPGLGWIAGEVSALAGPNRRDLKIPHMGWNDLFVVPGCSHPLLAGLGDHPQVYFVHSFALHCADQDQILAKTDYGGDIAAVVGRDNIVGTQFHPEKSQAAGLKILANFLSWSP
ncbi:MAG: imidazole glycerol phosphate synthase subunit HisH [Pseudomonadota bacterium]